MCMYCSQARLLHVTGEVQELLSCPMYVQFLRAGCANVLLPILLLAAVLPSLMLFLQVYHVSGSTINISDCSTPRL